VRFKIVGTGSALPERVLANSWFEQHLDTSDQWIRTRTGIRERRFAEPGESTSDYAARAGAAALSAAGIAPAEIDLVVLATTSPDVRIPATANFVVHRLGLTRAYAYDLSAACSGFIFAMANADAQLRAGMGRTALVIGADLYSALVDMTDRGTCVLFGDGAGALVLAPSEGADGAGIVRSVLHSDGSHAEILGCRGAGTAGRTAQAAAAHRCIHMEGPLVFRLAVERSCRAIAEVLEAEGLRPEQISRIIPHQANLRIIERIARHFDYPMERIEINLDRYGNTSAASIPTALDQAVRAGRTRPGDLVMLVAAGAGFNSGAVLVKF
jgi:3-oxoacyl-[acyl-carrier-protein] synthase-3